MADMNAFPVRAPSPELIPVPFKIKLDGANDGVIQEGAVALASFKHVAAGRYTAVFKQKFLGLASVSLVPAFAAAENLVPQVRAFDPLAAGGASVTISLLAAGVETDPPAFAGVNGWLFGVAWFRNTSVPS